MLHLQLESSTREGQTLRLGPDDSHYLRHVLRLAAGDTFRVLDASGNRFRAVALSVTDGLLDVRIDAEETADTNPAPGGDAGAVRIVLYQAVPKGRKFDDVIRGAVQAGATTIVPVITERTVVRLDSKDAGRTERWRRVAREAVQQSGALRPVKIAPPVPLVDLRAAGDAVSLFLHTEPIAQQPLHGYLDRVPATVEIVVGPEGGFAAGEVAHLGESGFRALYLGPRILRTETAALFALGAVQMLLQERGSWQPVD